MHTGSKNFTAGDLRRCNQLSIAVTSTTAGSRHDAVVLAKQLGLPLTDITATSYHFLLVLTKKRLELRQTGKAAPGPVYVDFVNGAIAYRQKQSSRNQPLGRAVGLKGHVQPLVFDVTAGLGRDGFILAALGCTVHMFERSTVIFSLLADGLRRASNDPATGRLLQGRLSLSCGDSRDLLAAFTQQKPDVVYLDPMYPHRTKSALVKKEIRLIRTLVGSDDDASQLLKIALSIAQKRVVVKRPASAAVIGGIMPDVTIRGKNHRFDVYLREP